MNATHPGYGAHARETLALGLPLVGSSLAQMALQVVNTVMVGWYGALALAALVLGSSTFIILFIMGTGFAKAVMPLAAAARARGDEADLRRSARMGLWLSCGFTLLVSPVFWFADPILLALGQEERVAAMAGDYLRIAGLALAPALGVAVLQGWLAALGRTQVVLWVTVAAVGVNVVMNWFLIFGNGGAPALGILGAAIASLVVQVASLVVLALYAALLPALRVHQLFARFWRVDRQALVQVFRLGLPIGFTGLAESGLFQASAVMMGWIGTVELAAHGIALEATAIAFMIHLGLSSAVTIRVAAFAGRGEARALRDAALVAIVISLAVVLCVIVTFVVWPGAIIRLFLDTSLPDSPRIVELGIRFLLMAAIFQTADAMQAIALGMLRGLRDTKVPMWIAAISYWAIGLPAGYLLAFHAGLEGVGLWAGLVVGLAATAAGLMTRFWLLAPKPGMAGEPAL